MGRILKFRGKRVDNGEWRICSSIEVSISGITLIGYEEVNPETVGQFTGLFDKNGKEIFEGDMVMLGHANDYSREIPHQQAVVKLFPALYFETFTKTEFGTPHEFHYGNFSYKDTHRHLEIIGNIHDNPELLNPDSE